MSSCPLILLEIFNESGNWDEPGSKMELYVVVSVMEEEQERRLGHTGG